MLLPPLLPLLLAGPALPQAQAGSSVQPLYSLIRAADADGDRRVTPEEWSAFVERLPFGPEPDAEADRGEVVALLLLSSLDADEDGALTLGDLDRTFASLDRDGNGAIEGAERPTGAPAAEGGPSTRELFLGGFLCLAADTDEDQRVSPEEWHALRAPLGQGDATPVTTATVRAWAEVARRSSGEADRNAMSAGVVVLTMEGALDANRDGRFDREDLVLHRNALDADGDGVLTVREHFAGSRGGGRPETRFAVTDEMRAKPPLIPWQRNLEDALALVEKTQKPLLICVNMDGETASDALAYGRYRDPAFAELVDGFVPLIVSPDRRNPLDHDDAGRRIPDPRFGRIVTGEAIALDPVLYDPYFSGRRVAPRHIGVSPEGEILFDVFLVQDLSVVDDALRRFGNPQGNRLPEPETEDELLASPDAGHRARLEALFAAGDEATRLRLAGRCLSAVRATQHPEVLRMALRDASPDVRRQALWTTAQNAGRVPSELFAEALNAATGEPVETAALLAALGQVGQDDSTERGQRARRLTRVFATLDGTSGVLDLPRWRAALRLAGRRSWVADTSGEAFDDAARLLEELEGERPDRPDDVELRLQLAGANMRLASLQIAHGKNPLFFLTDAEVAAEEALALAPDEPRALGYVAWSSYLLADLEKAGEYAERALPGLLPFAGTELAGRVLDVFAQSRTRALYEALGASRAFSGTLLPDARAAYEALALHPIAEERHVTAYLDLLSTVEAYALEGRRIRRALAADPTSSTLHAYLRNQVLRDEGAAALARLYDDELVPAARPEDRPALLWYAGVAHLVVAEHLRREHHEAEALAAYAASTEALDRSRGERQDFADSANHYRCLALAGASVVYSGEGRLAEAVSSLVEGIEARPASSQSADGLGCTPLDAAHDLDRRLRAGAHAELAETLERCLQANGLETSGT